MKRNELAGQLGLAEKALEGFSDETLNEMAQSEVEAGTNDDTTKDTTNNGICVNRCKISMEDAE